MKRKVSDVDLPLVDAVEFQLTMTEQHRKLIVSLLHGERAVDAAERGLMCVLTRSPGRRRLTYLVREVIPPEEGDIIYTGGVEFTPDYRRRVKRAADEAGGGVLYLHTHPWGEGRPSRQDLESAARLLHNDAQHLEHDNPPLAAGILAPGGNWMVLGQEFPNGVSLDEADSRYASAIRVVGAGLRKLETYTAGRDVKGAAGARGSWDPDTQDRQVRLWTEAAQETYASLRVGIVGLGGGGSILAPDVARSGVDGLVLADYDVVKDVNLNRQRGATEADASVWRPKVDVAARTARTAATNPDFDVVTVNGSVVEDDPDLSAHTDLLDFDVILHAADGHWTTRVLDEIAHAHLIPVISGGTRPETDADGVLQDTSKSPIAVSAPGQPCFRCCIQYLPSEARRERGGGREPGPDYNMGQAEADGGGQTEGEEPAPSVMSLNEIVAGLMHLRLQDVTLGVTGGTIGERRYLPGVWDFTRGRDECRSDCDRGDIAAAGQTHTFPLSKDHEFEALRHEVEERTGSRQAEVVLKGEIHTSESDLAEARELLTEGCDVFVLEGQQEDAEYGLLRSWYATAMSIVGLVFFRTLYTDHRILVDLAEAQGAEVVRTRTSDAELVENANPLVEFVAGVLFYGIFTVSVLYGLITGRTVGGASLLLGSALLPVFMLRYHGMTRHSSNLNRDSIMAEKIADAAENGGRVVAVVGANHLQGVEERLPDSIDPQVMGPAYGPFSVQFAKEIARPGFTAFSVLFVLYLLLLEGFRWLLILV